jgi:putative cell wall-binding protein/GH43 family beta-xylosidase
LHDDGDVLRRLRLVALAIVLVGVAAVFAAPAPGGANHGQPTYETPAFPDDFPDPFILNAPGDKYYGYATLGPMGNVQTISSTDLAHWTKVGNALPRMPAWSDATYVERLWAPAVVERSGSYVMFFAAVVGKETANNSRDNRLRCIGVATASQPQGPFTPDDSGPIVCDRGRNGSIDPSVFVDGTGTPYLLWKSEGIPGQEPPKIWIQQLEANARTKAAGSVATAILEADQPWEYPLIENPSMVNVGDRYWLFYSGQLWDTPEYAIGYASCLTPTGPCDKPPNRPLLVSSGQVAGPGAPELFVDKAGARWIAYHAWTAGKVGYRTGGIRTLRLRRIAFPEADLSGPSPFTPVLGDRSGQFPVPQRTFGIRDESPYARVARLSASTVPPNAPVTYVATGERFPDALAASAAAGKERSPVLLVTHGSVPPETEAELRRLAPGHIIVMGGPEAISDAVYNHLAQFPKGGLHREAGVNRYHTAALVSRLTFPTAGVVYVATGERFPDALAAGAAGARNGGPVLLVTPNDIPIDTRRELERLRPARIVIVGGPAAVSEGVEAALRGFSGDVRRVFGDDRYGTAMALTAEFGQPLGGVVVTTGEDFPDAVAAGATGMPVVLTPPGGEVPGELRYGIDLLRPLGLIAMGHPSLVSDQAVDSLR